MPGGHGLGLRQSPLLLFPELFGTVALPAILLTFSEVRNSIKGLYWAAGLSAFG